MVRSKHRELLLKDILETNGDNMPFDLEVALENVMDGNKGASTISHLDDIIYDAFLQLPKIGEPRTLFRFTSLASKSEKEWNGEECFAFNDIKNCTLTFGAPKLFNDPMDPLIKAWTDWRKVHSVDKIDKVLYQLVNGVLDRIRISCLAGPQFCGRQKREPKIVDCNPLMWAHYANNHKGICIQYRVNPENMVDNANLIVRLLDVNYDKPFPLDGNIPFLDSLCVKGDCWRYEKETRLIMYSRKQLSDYYSQDGYEIEAVYMGCRIEHEKRNYLKNMLSGTGIKLYQMAFNKDDISKLVAHEVK